MRPCPQLPLRRRSVAPLATPLRHRHLRRGRRRRRRHHAPHRTAQSPPHGPPHLSPFADPPPRAPALRHRALGPGGGCGQGRVGVRVSALAVATSGRRDCSGASAGRLFVRARAAPHTLPCTPTPHLAARRVTPRHTPTPSTHACPLRRPSTAQRRRHPRQPRPATSGRRRGTILGRTMRVSTSARRRPQTQSARPSRRTACNSPRTPEAVHACNRRLGRGRSVRGGGCGAAACGLRQPARAGGGLGRVFWSSLWRRPSGLLAGHVGGCASVAHARRLCVARKRRDWRPPGG